MKKLLVSLSLATALSLTGCAVEEAVEDASGAGGGGGGNGKQQAQSSMTRAQENAVSAAENYLDLSGFSRSGLIKQLKFEGYKAKDANFAVDNIKVNWRKQAARSAEQYLDTSPFSRDGLITQLEFEGFTTEQAAFGADQAGLN